jgi:hypothetical protein
MMNHVLYNTGDNDAPDVIKDGNGEVALGLCRVCGGGECALATECPEELVTAQDSDLICNGELDYKDGCWIES